MNFTSILMSVCCSEELGNCHQTPTLIGCIFLRNLAAHRTLRLLFLPAFAAISEALNYLTFLKSLSTARVFADSLCA
ncbi:hypothetical protein FN976_14500 [Caenimonas sedimenti]|uniref:Uncharacterized protein n=1 Tax=Caenimonas sedimenti TaxID=2596921 RepID=A0A562ZRG8_9BURK|nr:hypothetical protein [Caenimonas sedimenti]TWO70754.1 hypothetical protein FN976_14500 [Caenimonas sedimenti]